MTIVYCNICLLCLNVMFRTSEYCVLHCFVYLELWIGPWRRRPVGYALDPSNFFIHVVNYCIICLGLVVVFYTSFPSFCPAWSSSASSSLVKGTICTGSPLILNKLDNSRINIWTVFLNYLYSLILLVIYYNLCN